MAEFIEIKDPNRDIEKLKKCAECVDAGGLVVFPTETVYGIACKAESKSLERLDVVKQRNVDKRYTLHIGDKNKLSEYVPSLTMPAAKLVKNAWPGPLTIVFEISENEIQNLKYKHGSETVELLYKDNTIGIRCPDEPVGGKLLDLCKFPVVAPSANMGGQNPATNGRQAYEQIGQFVDIVIDAGTCKYEKSSTVAKISPSGIKILRAGAYSEGQIRKMYNINMLFVCSGNTCRSPMAEGLAKKKIAEKIGCNIDQLDDMGYKIESAGVLAVKGFAASDGSIRFCASKGIDISNHQSQRLTGEKIKNADYIFAMSNGHKDAIIQLCPQAEQKTMLLKDGEDINDPIGGDYDAYAACGLEIEKALDARMTEFFP
jgi:protein-tyrosine phosphatase